MMSTFGSSRIAVESFPCTSSFHYLVYRFLTVDLEAPSHCSCMYLTYFEVVPILSVYLLSLWMHAVAIVELELGPLLWHCLALSMIRLLSDIVASTENITTNTYVISNFFFKLRSMFHYLLCTVVS